MFLLLGIFLVLSSYISTLHSAPLPPDDIQTVGWVSDPNGRGTLSLLVSCLLSLSLCVWSAMHLNIPPKGETLTQYWTRTVNWTLLGIIIPELVILAAWKQWLSARQMDTAMRQLFESKGPSFSDMRRNKWTNVHSFYVGMGGFVFDQDFLPQGDEAILSSRTLLTLTPSGILLLARCGHLPDINVESIKDKSKADSVAKSIVCLQAAWMIFQTIGRLISHQTVTLIEVNTIAHIFCAFVMYTLWWNKLREAHDPIVLQGNWASSICAYMYMCSRISGQKPSGLLKRPAWTKPELSEFGWYSEVEMDINKSEPTTTEAHINDSSDTNSAKTRGDRDHIMDGTETPINDSSNASSVKIPGNQDCIMGDTETSNATTTDKQSSMTGALRLRPAHAITELPSNVLNKKLSNPPLMSKPDRIQLNRIKACEEAIRNYPALRAHLSPFKSNFPSPTDETPTWFEPETRQYVTKVAVNWPTDYYLSELSNKLVGMALWLSSSIYGGIHIIAWNQYFPTEIESHLWRSSALFIISSGLLWFIMCVMGYQWQWASQYWDRFKDLRATRIEYVGFGLVAFICGIAYILARLFLVVEALVSLRQLPVDAYDTPQWSVIFPHL